MSTQQAKRVELSRSDREAVFKVFENDTMRLEVETPDGTVYNYEDYIAGVHGSIPEPIVTKPRRVIHPAVYSGIGVVVAVALSHFIK